MFQPEAPITGSMIAIQMKITEKALNRSQLQVVLKDYESMVWSKVQYS